MMNVEFNSKFGSNKFFLLKMFTITHDLRTPSYQSGHPDLERLRAADAPGLAHQVANDSPHRFHRAGCCRQVQLGEFTICPEVLCSSEKLPHNHASTNSTTRSTDEFFEAAKDPLQLATIRKFQRLAGELVAEFTHISASDGSLSGSAIALQLADEMKVTELQDPPVVRSQRRNASDLVGDDGLNARARSWRNGTDRFQPTSEILPTRKKQRVQEKRVVLMTRFERHQIKHPRSAVETKVKTIDQKHQWAYWHTQLSMLRDESRQGLTKTITQSLMSQAGPLSKTFQRPSFQQYRVQKAGRRPPTLASLFFSPNTPRTLALAALTTPRAKTINFGSTTRRFRVRRIHARELSAY
jgi:hypothetical protein